MISLFVAFISCRNITISKRGTNSSYQIVIPTTEKNKEPWWSFAARELQSSIQKITGEKLEIITDNKDIKNKAILIGPNKYSKQFTDLKFIDLGLDAYEIRFVQNEHLVINGGSRGNIYGVYELLERCAKVRFLTSWMEIYPEAEEFNVDSDINMEDVAGFQYRSIWGTDTTLSHYHYVKKRANAGDEGLGYETGGYLYSTFGVHSFWTLFTQKEYPTSKYPEMWALLPNGKRSTSAPCLTNTDTFKAILGNIVKQLQKDNESTYIQIGHGDDFDHCHCENCTFFKNKYGNRFSGVLLAFCNNLSIALKENYPRHTIIMLAYYMTEDPPENIQGLDNVGIKLAPLGNDIGHALNETEVGSTVLFKEKVANWSKYVKTIHLYEYHTNFNYPMNTWPNYHMIGENIKYYYNIKCNGYFAEDVMGWILNPTRIINHADQTYFKQYVMSKMMFYPWRSVRYYENEFMYGYYGSAAAGYVRKYFDVTKELADRNKTVRVGCLAGPLSDLHNPNYIYYSRYLWKKAVEAARKQGDYKQIWNTEMAELPSCMTVFYYEKSKKWPLIVDDKGKVRMKDTLIEECTTKILDRCHNVSYKDNYTRGICAITRFLEGENSGIKVYKELEYFRDAVPAQVIKSGNLQAIAGERPAYGRVFSYTKNGKEYINTTEGIDFFMAENFRIIDSYDYDMKNVPEYKSDTGMKFVFENDKGKCEKTYSISNDGLKLNFKYTNKKSQTSGYAPTYVIPIDLGDTSDIFYKLGSGNWERPQFDVVATYVNHFGKATKGQTTFSICSGKTKVGFKFDFIDDKTSYFSVQLDKSAKLVKVFIGKDFVELKENDNYENTITALPIENVGSLPSTPMPSLDTGNKIVHFYPLYYFGAKFNGWRPRADDKTFLGVSGVTLGHLKQRQGMISFSPAPFLYNVFGKYGADLNFSFRTRCENPNLQENDPWWYGFSRTNQPDKYSGSSRSSVPKEDVFFYINLYPMKNASNDINVWLECTSMCENFWVDGIRLLQDPSTHAFYGPTYPTYNMNEEISPMKEPDFYNFEENIPKEPNIHAGMIAGFVLLGLVLIVVSVFIAFVIINKKKENAGEPHKEVAMKTIIV